MYARIHPGGILFHLRIKSWTNGHRLFLENIITANLFLFPNIIINPHLIWTYYKLYWTLWLELIPRLLKNLADTDMTHSHESSGVE